MVYVDNAAEAHLAAAEALATTGRPGGKAYFVTQGAPVRCWEWIDEVLALAGLPPLRRRIPLPAAYAVGTSLEAAYSLLRLKAEPPMTRFLALQLGRHHYFSIEAARRDFNYEVRVDQKTGMSRLADWLKRTSRLEGNAFQS